MALPTLTLTDILKYKGFDTESVLRRAFSAGFDHLGDMIDALLIDQSVKNRAHFHLSECFQLISEELKTRGLHDASKESL